MKPEPQFQLGDFVKLRNIHFNLYQIVDIFQGIHVSSHSIDDELVVRNLSSGQEICTPSKNADRQVAGERFLKLFYG